MRYVRLLFLHFQNALEHRSRSFVWFLLALINALIYLLFWRGSLLSGQTQSIIYSLSEIAAYYFVLILAGVMLTVHIEEDVAYWDIKEGGLSKYLIRPFPYFWIKFFEEFPYRLVQGLFGIISFIILQYIFQAFIPGITSLLYFLSIVAIWVFAYLLSFVFKMIIGLTALWVTEFSGLHQFVIVVITTFAGYLMPLDLFHPFLKSIAYFLPFSYMIYFPVKVVLGNMDSMSIASILFMQLLWLVVLILFYRFLFQAGLRKYVAVGQ